MILYGLKAATSMTRLVPITASCIDLVADFIHSLGVRLGYVGLVRSVGAVPRCGTSPILDIVQN